MHKTLNKHNIICRFSHLLLRSQLQQRKHEGGRHCKEASMNNAMDRDVDLQDNDGQKTSAQKCVSGPFHIHIHSLGKYDKQIYLCMHNVIIVPCLSSGLGHFFTFNPEHLSAFHLKELEKWKESLIDFYLKKLRFWMSSYRVYRSMINTIKECIIIHIY